MSLIIFKAVNSQTEFLHWHKFFSTRLML